MDKSFWNQRPLLRPLLRIGQDTKGFQDGFPIITMWIFFNVLTWFITHKAVSLNHRVELERKLRTAMGQIKK